jgi:hypothetical protein
MRGQIFSLAFYALLVGYFVISFELILAEEITEIPITTEDTDGVKESLSHSLLKTLQEKVRKFYVLLRSLWLFLLGRT